MNIELLRFVALIVGPSITSAARPALTFLAVQIMALGLVHYELTAVPTGFAWLVSAPAIVVAAVLAGLETAAKHDPDIAALLRDFRIDNITGAFGAFSVALLFAALGLPESEVALLAEGVETGGLLDATALAISTDRSDAVQVGAIGGALFLNLGLTWFRGELLEFVDDFELGRWWARLETGGVVGVLLLMPLLPLVMVGFLVALAGALVVFAVIARTAARLLDERSRVPCDECGHAVREEASLCPNCGANRTPEVAHDRGLHAALSALRRD